MKPSCFSPTAGISTRLLVDFLCNVVAMRSDHHGALIRGLAEPGQNNRIHVPRSADDDGSGDGEEDVMPWEEPVYEVKDGIAVVDVSGPVVKGYSALVCWYYGLMSSDRLEEAIAELETRADVAAVVFNFNSPGGMAIGTPEIADAIVRLGESKVTVAFTGVQVCSAAYWMASACSAFFTTKSAIVGSIGTYIAFYDYCEMLKQWGISLELFRAGSLKAIGVMGKPITDEERAFLTDSVNRTNAGFTGFVKSRRAGVADSTMQGQWFDGAQAVELKLADAVVPNLSAVVSGLRQNMKPPTTSAQI
jgi:signal peptide peptidase SppA